MKKKLRLVDGYNMIAFWQETKQTFSTNQLDQARTILLQKLNHYANFEGIEIVCVFAQGCLRVSACGLEQRVNAVKSNIDAFAEVIDQSKHFLSHIGEDQQALLKDFMKSLE
ncbi:NYN domain-containing protein [Streptococcus porci]|uniref:NYN domain-containing protein n=1 Tax=Streptococcus porci TaxID=502567 RepID=UPI0004074DF4|nr:NYN domain-containing protein [Streptococcus porci]